MRILGIESSAVSVSVAVCEIHETDRRILASGSINTRLMHSETLVPLLEQTLLTAKLQLSDMDCFAVANGPGSFTGLRIGISVVKGMAYALQKPVIPVSSLYGLACNAIGLGETSVVLCPVMDARRNQVYTALFHLTETGAARDTEDMAISIEALEPQLCAKQVMLLGDGAEKVIHALGAKHAGLFLAPPLLRTQNAASVCFAAAESVPCTAAALVPGYLRLPQAERERLEKLKSNG